MHAEPNSLHINPISRKFREVTDKHLLILPNSLPGIQVTMCVPEQKLRVDKYWLPDRNWNESEIHSPGEMRPTWF